MAKLRVGIIGCGTIFPMHAESVKQVAKKEAELAAVCDNKQGNLTAAADKYSCASYEDYKEMLDKENLDIVHVCTPHYLHKEMALYAAEKGVNIFLEKPMGLNSSEAEEINKKVKEKGVKLAVSFQNRYNPSTKLAKQLIKSGETGKIISAKLFITWHKPDEYYLKSDWKGTFDKEGGGVVIDQAIHSLDLLRYLFDSEIDYVDATTVNRMHEKVQVEDEASGVIMFKSGAYVNFYVTNHYSYDDDLEMEIHCERAMINIVKDSAEAVFMKNWKKKKAGPKKSDYIDYGGGVKDYWGVCHSIQIKEFYEAVRDNKEVFVDGDEGLATQKLVDAIYESGKTGERVIF